MDDQRDAMATRIEAVLGWQLQHDEWKSVEELLADLDQAVIRSDWEFARVVAIELMLIGPIRAGRGLDDGLERIPPSQGIQDVVNRLLHRLGRPPKPEARDGDNHNDS
jgi:hypothetical protein